MSQQEIAPGTHVRVGTSDRTGKVESIRRTLPTPRMQVRYDDTRSVGAAGHPFEDLEVITREDEYPKWRQIPAGWSAPWSARVERIVQRKDAKGDLQTYVDLIAEAVGPEIVFYRRSLVGYRTRIQSHLLPAEQLEWIRAHLDA